ncbi:MAG: permease component of ABC-type sugar transporter [Actinomycetia bacterium]|nr:permease component of ABC-type sugar transporter [Actinomycetes bacterium]
MDISWSDFYDTNGSDFRHGLFVLLLIVTFFWTARAAIDAIFRTRADWEASKVPGRDAWRVGLVVAALPAVVYCVGYPGFSLLFHSVFTWLDHPVRMNSVVRSTVVVVWLGGLLLTAAYQVFAKPKLDAVGALTNRGRRAKDAELAYALLLPSFVLFGEFVFYPFARNFRASRIQPGLFPGQPGKHVGWAQWGRFLDTAVLGKSIWYGLGRGLIVFVILFLVAGALARAINGSAKAVWKPASIAILFAVPFVMIALVHFFDTSDSDFANSFKVTILFAVFTVIPGIVLGLLLAVVANQRLRGMGFYRVVFSSPIITGVAASSVIFFTLLNPQVGLLPWLGLETNPALLQNPSWALVSVSGVVVWANLGLVFILMSAGLQTIPDDLYEAARVDGAGAWRRFWSITVPMLSPTIFFTVVVGSIFAFQAFGQIQLLTSGGPLKKTNVLTFQIYQDVVQGNTSKAGILSIALFVIVLVFTVIQLRVLERRVEYGN